MQDGESGVAHSEEEKQVIHKARTLDKDGETPLRGKCL